MSSNLKTGFFGLAVAIVLVFPVMGCHSGADSPVASDTSKYVLPDSLYHTLNLDTVGICKVVNMVTLTGQVDFNEDNVVKIYPMVSGSVTDVKVMLGDYVQEGQVLAVVHSSEMAGYSSELINAQTNLSVAKKNLDATIDMFHGGLASEKDSLTAAAGYDQAKAELTRINEVLSINGGGNSGNDVIKSPISGFIVEKFVTNNMVIRSDNSSNLFTISDLKNVWIMANVYESNIEDIHLGDSVNITTLSYPGKIFRGKVDKLMNVLDPTNKVMKVRIVLANPDYLLKPEMFASVRVMNPENKLMLCVPQKAVIFDNSQYYILVYKSNSNITITPVQVVMSNGDKDYITGGVTEGEKVISSQTLLIYQALNT